MQNIDLNNKIKDWQSKRKQIIDWLGQNGYKDLLNKLNDSTNAPKFFPLSSGKKLKDIKIAAIMDPFTLTSYKPECELIELTPANWKKEIEQFKPDLLFIESAWKGKDELWYRKVDRFSEEMKDLTDYCHEKAIPIVFWNKEDPVYTDSFMLTASYADVVFTTDIDCIAKYKAELGHNNVFHLHFAAQPTIHNPIEKYDRADKFCFAGAYYHRYKERSEVFDDFADEFIARKGFDIYDRNLNDPRPDYAFPDRYKPNIVGTLSPDEIDKAYKGYVYGINMNSILQSQTMFARRVFEMMASNTVTVGNFSRGLKNYFGDLTVCTNDKKTLSLYFDKYFSDNETCRKYRLKGLRKVLSEDLYEDRLAYIVEKVFGKDLKPELPKVIVFSKTDSDEETKRVKRMFEKQTYQNKVLSFIRDGKIKANIQDGDFIAFFDPSDWYGENYLTDLMLTLRYYKAKGMGKACYYKDENGETSVSGTKIYTPVNKLTLRRAVVSEDVISTGNIRGDFEVMCDGLFSTDEFNYCENRKADECERAADLYMADTGLSAEKIRECAENIKPLEMDDGVLRFKGEDIAKARISEKLPIKFIADGKNLKIESDLPEDKHEYIYLQSTKFDVTPWIDMEGKLSVFFRGAGDLDLICVLLCFDKNDNKLKALFPHLGRNERLELPEGTATCEFGFRPRGKGTSTIREILIGAVTETSDKTCFLSRSDVLIVSNHYPSEKELYRNMFVHKRLTAYKSEGHVYDVMRMHPFTNESYREFEGINVVETKGAELRNALDSGMINTVCVHFLDRDMWDILKNYTDRIRLLIWSHGADIQPWWRRQYNCKNDTDLNAAKAFSDERMKMWYEVFNEANKNGNIRFIYVSEYFANEIMEDYKIKLDRSQYYVIHNLIDTEMFTYSEKDPEERKKLLTVKPFAGPKYANDLTTKAITELSNRKCFKDIEIDIYGQGEFFEEDNKPLTKFKNVHLHECFLTQAEIKEAHKGKGIFIATTRWDSHGVSRDEAMSSGLVPITHNCSAIPEFVDENCAMLVPPESYIEIADAIEKLYNEPKLFAELSKNAAARVRRQTAKEFTIDKELALINGKD